MAAASVYLHVGPGKTGTTSIQNALFAGRDHLKAHGISYWSVDANHSLPLVLLLQVLELPESGFSPHLIPRWHNRFGSSPALKASLLAEIAAADGPFLLSAELVSQFPKAQLHALRELLECGGAAIRVIYYVREPRGWFNSIVLHRLKEGTPISEAMQAYRRLPYRAAIEALDETFGPGNVSLRFYTQSRVPEQSLMADFLDAIGLSRQAERDFPLRWENSAMSADATRILDAVGRIGRAQNFNRLYGWLLNEFLDPIFARENYCLDSGILDAVAAENADQLAWLAGRMGREMPMGEAKNGKASDLPPLDDRMAKFIFSLTSEILNLRSALIYQRGITKWKQGDLDGAFRAFTLVLTTNPQHEGAARALKRLEKHKFES